MKKKRQQKQTLQNANLKIGASQLKDEVWLTTEDAMELLKVSRSTLYRMRKNKEVPWDKRRRSPMYPKYSLNKVLITRAMHNVEE